MAKQHVCKIDFNVNDTLRSVRALIERLESSWKDTAADDELVVDMERCRYLGPDAVAILSAEALIRDQLHQRLTIRYPKGPSALRSFLKWSGLASIVHDKAPAPPSGAPEFNVLPVRRFSEASFQGPIPLISLIQREADITEDAEEYLRSSVNEIMQNVQDHSASPIGGVWSAKYMSTAQEVRVAIVDRGRGIKSTLRTTYPDTTDSNCLPRVVEGEYSAKSRINNAGLGLYHLFRIIKRRHGELCLISERSVANLARNGNTHYETLRFRFPGTAVFFTFPTAELL